MPTGRGRALATLGPDEIEDVLNFAYDVGAAVPTKTTEGHHFRRFVIQRRVLEAHGLDHVTTLGLGPRYRALHDRLRQLGLDVNRRVRRPPLDLNAGRGFAFISHVGDVHPSGFLPIAAGSVRQQSLTEIYRTSPLFVGLRDPDRLSGRCGACEFRPICGGSRSRAFAVSGDPYAEAPCADTSLARSGSRTIWPGSSRQTIDPRCKELVLDSHAAAAELFRTLASPLRLAILRRVEDRPACVHELVEATGASQSLVSQHLRILRAARLVLGERRGREVAYSLVDRNVTRLIEDAIAHVGEPPQAVGVDVDGMAESRPPVTITRKEGTR